MLKKRFDTLTNYELDRTFPKEKNEKVIALMKDELGGKVMSELIALKTKTYSCLTDNKKGTV